MYLFFDTETNGRPLDFQAPATDLEKWPRITQLGWILYDKNEKLIKERTELIKPDGWVIPKEKFFIDNNMSTERCEQFGKPLREVMSEFIEDIEKSKYLIAHNMNFDSKVLGAEMIRMGVKAKNKTFKVCTMKSSIEFCKIPNKYGGYKWPTLTELHTKLFNKGFEGAHDALDDVKACARSFFELKKQGVQLNG